MKRTRREILNEAVGVLAGLGVIGCARQVLSEEPQQRREVIVNGKRIRTVDVHAHCHIPEANALMGLKVPQPSVVVLTGAHQSDGRARHRRRSAEHQSDFWYKAEPDLAAQVVKLQNEKLAEICAAQPDRFVGMASVALQHPALAVAQLENGVKQLGLRGALIGGSVNGEELSDPKFHPFWAKAEELGVLIFIHPQGTGELGASGRLKGNGVLET